MRTLLISLVLFIAAGLLPGWATASDDDDDSRHGLRQRQSVQLGDRPFFLVNDMTQYC